ncbi:acyl carrier protein [Streptomyces sp. TLI_146]|uniref:acyl carrier protein n=1 Tax=Streptomyces sp. TLI_146 TaxID=1938858 RepID=UPI000CA6755A|nr:phosphopantetheine-binding protein [Streptomyces sp. TLI_146]PKV83838.1 phosphopantetheine binding protein [Streptomyces sp. TLI_146]
MTATAIADAAGFCALLEDELGIRLAPEDLDRPLDDVAEWDSVHLLRLVTVVENVTGRRVPVADLLEAATFQQMYEVVRA